LNDESNLTKMDTSKNSPNELVSENKIYDPWANHLPPKASLEMSQIAQKQNR